jgi:hypothetical protein
MTDDMDHVLTDAGARWRATQPAPPEPVVPRDTQLRRRRWLAVTATAAGVAIVTAGAAVLTTHTRPLPASTGPNGPAARVDPATLVVRNGDLVEASGKVIAAPGKPVVLCPPLAEPAIGYLPGKEPAPTCPATLAVTVVGVDLGRLAEPATVQGVRTGYAMLRGTWKDRVVTVTAQGPPAAEPASGPDLPVLCAPPPGGWLPGEGTGPGESNVELGNYLQQHPDQFGQPWVGWPAGMPSGATDAPSYTDKPSVLVVPVVAGDLDRIRTDLTAIYHGNLCVARAPAGTLSQQRTQSVLDRVTPLMDAHANGIYQTGADQMGRVTVDLAFLDQRRLDTLRRIGLADVTLVPWLRLVGR